jgi:hypothetical protein
MTIMPSMRILYGMQALGGLAEAKCCQLLQMRSLSSAQIVLMFQADINQKVNELNWEL